ncbi:MULTISPECIES: glycosyltransferase [Microbacterium]|uniref:glycosyltransferase n=1 Tax=Microbacterium TaxID=33882 RepID=UPI0013A5A313|nr:MULTISPECIES: glycosyltransferase [Microbacterium]
MTQPHPTTIVVPLYGDIPTAARCVRSVLDHVDLDFHRLLIVNDCGPEVDEMERQILAIIDGVDGVVYARNERNLGFVGTCNRAVTELDTSENDVLLLNSDAQLSAGTVDELSTVLYLSEKHGVVTARSNHATIATLPLRTRSGEEASPERSREVFDEIASELPRYSIAPVAHGFCFLARRSLIRNYGLFDEVFAPGYGEENDFCLRVNDYGFSSVIANHAYAHHDGEKSFSSLDRRTIQDANERRLVRRYPHYPSAVAHYLEDGIDTADWFADLLVPSDARKKVLIDLHHMSLIYNGSVQYALSFLNHLATLRDNGMLDELEFVIATSAEAIEFFGMERYGFRVVANEDLDELFDLGLSLAPLNAAGQIQRLDRYCVKWVASLLDIIAIRSLPLLESDYSRRQVVLDSLRFADRVIAISQATIDDARAYYPSLSSDFADRASVLHLGVEHLAVKVPGAVFDLEARFNDRQRAAVRAGDYVLVIGNTFLHKQVRETVAALEGTERTVIAFGSMDEDAGSNIVPLPSGYLTDADVSALYDAAGVIVYPSAYEGFGLPIAEAAVHGKPIVLFDSQVAHEVVDALGLTQSAAFFDDFRRLPEVVEQAASLPLPDSVSVRTLQDYNEGVFRILLETLAEPVVIDRVRARNSYFRATRSYELAQSARAAHLEWRLSRRSFRIADAVVRRLEFLRPIARGARQAIRRERPEIDG